MSAFNCVQWLSSASPMIDIVLKALLKEAVIIQWVLVQGEVSKLALGYRTEEDSSRKKRETVNGFVIILDNIQPDNTDIIANGTFDLSVENEFMMFADESNLTKHTGESGSGQVVFEAEGKKSNLIYFSGLCILYYYTFNNFPNCYKHAML